MGPQGFRSPQDISTPFWNTLWPYTLRQSPKGDSRILMQKMARDYLKLFQRRGYSAVLFDGVLQRDAVLRRRTFKA